MPFVFPEDPLWVVFGKEEGRPPLRQDGLYIYLRSVKTKDSRQPSFWHCEP